MIIHRRALLRGLFATPAIVAASSLMPLRGVRLLNADDIVWRPIGAQMFRWIAVYDPKSGEIVTRRDLKTEFVARDDTIKIIPLPTGVFCLE